MFILGYPILNDTPQPWQIGFQDSAAPGFEGINDLHDSIFFYLIIIQHFCCIIFYLTCKRSYFVIFCT